MDINTIKRFYHAKMAKLPPSLSLKIDFFRRHRYWPDFDRPKTFSEKIYREKLKPSNAYELVRFTDKALVKSFVADILGSDWVNPNLWSGKDVSTIPDEMLGSDVAIKANYGSGMNLFFPQVSRKDLDEVKAVTDSWVTGDWPDRLSEPWYNFIDKKIVVEPLLAKAGMDLPDYKIFVFDSKVEFIQVDTARFGDHQRSLFSPQWERLSFSINTYPQISQNIPAPQSLLEMMKAAVKLSEGYSFMRVDFYEVEGRPIFGEMTFTPGAGQSRIIPRSMDHKLGSLWK